MALCTLKFPLPKNCCRLVLLALAITAGGNAQNLNYQSSYFRVRMAADQPNFSLLAVDSLGQNKLDGNVMLPLASAGAHYQASRTGDTIAYRLAGAESSPAWSFTFSDQGIVIRSSYSPQPLVLSFDPHGSHATLLGLMTDQGDVLLPALLPFPDHGTFRIHDRNSRGGAPLRQKAGRMEF